MAICGLFFVAQMTAVLVLAEMGEADESVHETTPGTEPTETTPSEPTQGDPVAGKEVFAGPGGCGAATRSPTPAPPGRWARTSTS